MIFTFKSKTTTVYNTNKNKRHNSYFGHKTSFQGIVSSADTKKRRIITKND
jgi:hypothetical protein